MLLKLFILHCKQHCTTSPVVWDESLKAEADLYISLRAVYWAHRAICIKCYDFEWHMKSTRSSHFTALSTIILTIITLSYSDTASLSSFMICRTTVATFNLSCQMKWGTVLTDPFSEIPVVADAAERGAACFSDSYSTAKVQSEF
jgi:hypothetical protein